MKDEIKSVRGTVDDVLAKSERARRNNKYLVMKVWCELDVAEYNVQSDEVRIPMKKLHELPSTASILRVRRKLQEENLYPAPEEVRKKRRKNEEEMEKIGHWW